MTCRALAFATALSLGAALLRAQEGERRVPVTVTSTAGFGVYLDKGRADGIEPGTVVRLYAPVSGTLEVVVRTASRSSSRADLEPGMPVPPAGTRGEARVTAAPLRTAPAPGAPRPGAAEHPPWSRVEDPRPDDQPLLVPTFGPRPEDRPTRITGTVSGSALWMRDRGDGRVSDYSLLGLGVSFEATNPFGTGGRLQFDGVLDSRRSEDLLVDETVDDLRIDRLAWFQGEEQDAPHDWAAGRFTSVTVPELGLVDGVEGGLRLQPGLRIGAGAGAYPLPFPDRQSGDDLGFHVFAELAGAAPGALHARAAFQQTWHEGHPDRDLIVLAAEGRPADRLSLHAMAKVDLYTSGDVRKAGPIELTEFLGTARWDDDDAGLGLLLQHFRWPDIEREEYPGLTDALVHDGRVDRVEIDGWWALAPDLRLSAFTGYWSDQTGHGVPWEVAGELRSILDTGASLQLAVFHTDGIWNAGPGLRAQLRAPLGDDAALLLGYGWHRYDLLGLQTGVETYTRQSLRAGLDWSAGPLDFDLEAEYRFGDQEDAWSLSLFAQYRF